jgi:cephalosporin hydroxylase
MRPGEYIVIEDGIVHELGLDMYEDGPNQAIAVHLATFGMVRDVDRDYYDFYGQNYTWATNGYIKYKRLGN